MNLKKIEKVLEFLSDKIQEDVLTDKEYLVMVANLLYTYGNSGLISAQLYPDLNIEDAFQVELALVQDPNNI